MVDLESSAAYALAADATPCASVLVDNSAQNYFYELADFTGATSGLIISLSSQGRRTFRPHTNRIFFTLVVGGLAGDDSLFLLCVSLNLTGKDFRLVLRTVSDHVGFVRCRTLCTATFFLDVCPTLSMNHFWNSLPVPRGGDAPFPLTSKIRQLRI